MCELLCGRALFVSRRSRQRRPPPQTTPPSPTLTHPKNPHTPPKTPRPLKNTHTQPQHLNLSIDTDSRIALVGPNGAGKSTLLKLISGDLEPCEGAINRHPHLSIGVYHQHSVDQLIPEVRRWGVVVVAAACVRVCGRACFGV